MRRMLIASMLLLTAGCASQAPQREAAQILTFHTTTVQRELTEFSARRTEIDKERLRNAKRLLDSALLTEDFNARTQASMSSERKKLFDETLAVTAASVERNHKAETALKERTADISATTSRVATRKDQLTAASKALSRLAQPDKFIDVLKFYRDFAKEVRDAIKEAAEKAKKDAETAVAGAKTMVQTQENAAAAIQESQK